MKENLNFVNEEEENPYMKYIDLSSTYLPEPPNSHGDENVHTSENNKSPNILHEQSELNILLIGTRLGCVYIDIFGAFPCSELQMREFADCGCSVESVAVSEDFQRLFVTVKDQEMFVKIVVIDFSPFKTHAKELFSVALKYVRISYLVEIISDTIRNITETWESMLLEMDNKLSTFASKCPENCMSAEFLDLLMFGIYSSNMEEFLLRDLTKKGLERFGQSIEMSYSTIQELLLKYVTKYGQSITYHLAELQGMVRLKDKYEVISLSEEDVAAAINATGSFLIKTGEMHQIINNSIIKYKAFFRWLYTSIMNLLEEPIPVEIPKMTQQDLAYITEFFQNFDYIGEKKGEGRTFFMERLGQYLTDDFLTSPPEMNGNEWSTLLSENNCLKNHSSIFKHDVNFSLVQQLRKLKDSLNNVFQRPNYLFMDHLEEIKLFTCLATNDEEDLKMSVMNISKKSVLHVFLLSPKELTFIEIVERDKEYYTKAGKFHFSRENTGTCYEIIDFKFYTPSILSVLLQETHIYDIPIYQSILYQLNLTAALETLLEYELLSETAHTFIHNTTDACSLDPKIFKVLDMPVSQLAVSGSRKVGIVLSENQRRVKLFEMEGDEEDDEDADMSTTIISPRTSEVSENSMQEK